MRHFAMAATGIGLGTVGLAGGLHGSDEVLWDNGDANGSNGFSNGTAEIFGGLRSLLDDFVVPEGEQWVLCGLQSLRDKMNRLTCHEQLSSLGASPRILLRQQRGLDPSLGLQ